ncbi:MAG: pyridoxamine 5'-phosphate oxidase family protein [Candidatus Nanopelagicales bacterium]
MDELGWDEIVERFGAAQNWWVATSGTGGPHTVPVWGVAVDGALHFYGEASSVRSRNLAADPRVVLHLESGSDVLVLHGSAPAGAPAHTDAGVVAAYRAKYTHPTDLAYLPDADGMAAVLLHTVEPVRAFAWRFDGTGDGTVRRWRA